MSRTLEVKTRYHSVEFEIPGEWFLDFLVQFGQSSGLGDHVAISRSMEGGNCRVRISVDCRFEQGLIRFLYGFASSKGTTVRG